jgi:hypothetical protein
MAVRSIPVRSSLERTAFTVAEFCSRNCLSRPTYHRLRAQGRGPVEMRVGINKVLISVEAEKEWQQKMQESARDVETRAVERAVKAGNAAVKSAKHVSKKRLARGNE